MGAKRLPELLERARQRKIRRDPKLNQRERIFIEAICRSGHGEDEQSVDELVNEPSTGDPERDEFKSIVRKLHDADRSENEKVSP